MRVVVLGVLYALLFGQVIRAQSAEHKPKTCVPSPCPSSDAFEEMTGKNVYPKMIVDDVKFDGSARLPDSSEEPEAISELKQHMPCFSNQWAGHKKSLDQQAPQETVFVVV